MILTVPSFPYHPYALNSWMQGIKLCLFTQGAPENQARFKDLRDSIEFIRLKAPTDTVPEIETLIGFIQKGSSSGIYPYAQLQEIFTRAMIELKRRGLVV